MKAYLTDPSAPGAIRTHETTAPVPESNEVLVRVSHFSLNRGELHFAQTGSPGRALGWDVAGVVLSGPPQGPAAGSTVAGFSRASRGWAEKVAIPLQDLAVVPTGVRAAEAASLPVAALTALYSLERGERLLGSRILVTGSTGGVGNFAVALGRLAGAEVVAQVRREAQVQSVLDLGAHQVVVDEDGEKVAAAGPYRLILDGLGNRLTSRVIHSLTPDGIAVIYGVSDRHKLEIQPEFLLGTGAGRIEGFNLYRESEIESISKGLQRLLRLVSQGTLKVPVERTVSWDQAPLLAQELIDRRFTGKAVVEVEHV